MTLGQPVADNRQVGDDAVDIRIVLVKGAERRDRFLGQALELRQQVVDGLLPTLQSAARLLDQRLQAGSGFRVEGAEELVEIDRAQRVVAVGRATARQFGSPLARRVLDVFLWPPGLLPNA